MTTSTPVIGTRKEAVKLLQLLKLLRQLKLLRLPKLPSLLRLSRLVKMVRRTGVVRIQDPTLHKFYISNTLSTLGKNLCWHFLT